MTDVIRAKFDGKEVPLASGYVSTEVTATGVSGPSSTTFDKPAGFHRNVKVWLTVSADFAFGRVPKPVELELGDGRTRNGLASGALPFVTKAGDEVSLVFPEVPSWH